ncbi:DUF5017 domain-containing protein [Pedobacter heparinus]|uniref:DUF5017 domain-containing protein n=1 Tax=Pedobacter heparinus TaxID=984 RepID=UPI00292CBF99|nr:DUF5017 domain-containing protein [Pedobacter heparinus]
MKFLNISMLAGVLLFAACDKTLEEKQVTFDVSSTKIDGQASDTFTEKDTIVYQFNGNAEVVTFYSGIVGQRYEFKDRITAKGIPQLTFSTIRATGAQANSLQLLVSSDFKGVVAKSKTVQGVVTQDTAATMSNIAVANWTNISTRATWSTGATAAVSSGVIDLSDFDKGVPVFIAFKYLATAGATQNKWTISALSLNNVLPDNTVYTQANFAAPNQSITNYGVNTPGLGWLSTFDEGLNKNRYRWVYSSGIGAAGTLVITGATSAGAATAGAEAWAILGPIDLRKVSPDAGLPIKDVNKLMKSYADATGYTEGKYKVTFVASNNTVNGTSDVVRQLPIAITKP